VIKYLTKEEFRSLLKASAGPRDRAILLISYWRGLRIGEVGRIQMTDWSMDPDRPSLGRIRIERLKNSIGGSYLCNPDETKAMKGWLKVRGKSSGAIFISNRRTGISTRMLDKWFKQICKRATIPEDKRHFHVLKHSICTHLHQQGVDLLRIQEWVGHRNINSTVQYTHLVDGKRDELGLEMFDKF
jgi:site-specific recombinase XerD